MEKTPGFKADLNEIDEREDRTEERDSGVQKALKEEGEGLPSIVSGGRRAEIAGWNGCRWRHKSDKYMSLQETI